MHIFLIHGFNQQAHGGYHHYSVRGLDTDNYIVKVLALKDTQELHATLNDTLGGVTVTTHDTIRQRTVVHADTYCRVMLLTDIQERHQLLLDLLQFGCILLVGIFQMLERTTWINVVARIDTHLLTVLGSHIGGMSSKVHIGHQWCIVTIGLKLGRNVLHVLSLAGTLGGKANQLATSVDNTLGLGHTALGIIGIYRSHRLNADGVLTANADTADTGFGRLSSAIH